MAKYTTKDPIYKHIQKLETQLKAAGFEDDHAIWDDVALAKHAIENPADSEFNGLHYITQESGISSAMLGMKAAMEAAPESAALNRCINTFNSIQDERDDPNTQIAGTGAVQSLSAILFSKLGALQDALNILPEKNVFEINKRIQTITEILNAPTSSWAATHQDTVLAQAVMQLHTPLAALMSDDELDSKATQNISDAWNNIVDAAATRTPAWRQEVLKR